MSWQFQDIETFGGFEEEWNDLHRRGGTNQLLDFTMAELCLRHFGRPGIQLAVHREEGQTTAAALLHSTGRGRWCTFQPAQAPIGFWIQEAQAAFPDLIESLRARLPGLALAFGVQQIEPDLIARPSETPRLRTMDYIETARITVPGAFEEYWSGRGRNLRKNMRRQASRLDREGVVARLAIVDDPAQARAAVEEYGRIESAGWKLGHGTAVHIDNVQGRFYADLMERAMRRGEGLVLQYYYGEALVATDLCLNREGTLIILKTTYDEAQEATSPAHLMRREAFERLFDSGTCRCVEFYGPAKEWHRKWSDELRFMYHATCYRYGWIPDLAAKLRRSGD